MLNKIKQLLGMNGVGDEMVGSISTLAGNFAPRCFLDCNGQQLPVSEFAALFSILGTTYGGDGRNMFALPDLRPFANDKQPDTGHRRKVDWSEVGMPRQVICVTGIYPSRP